MYQLKDFILNDIIKAIDMNVNVGNLTLADAGRLRNLVAELYRHIYSHYKEFQEEGINDMVDEGLVLRMDVIEYEHKKELEAKIQEVTKEVTTEVTEQLVRNVFEGIGDVQKTAELLKIPFSQVEKIIKNDKKECEEKN